MTTPADMTRSHQTTSTPRIPDKPTVDGLEEKWMPVWDEEGTYRFDRDAALAGPREDIHAIDTPPPTASGSLHVGHVFGYSQADANARYRRMSGKHVFYPIGWDDNGLPTERRVQNYYGVRGDASLGYDPGFVPPLEGAEGKSVKAKDQVPVGRKNFIELCEKLTEIDEQAFEDTFKRLGLSVDWDISYRTIDDRSRAVAQQAFLRNLARGEAYQSEAPGLWDVTFQTAVAQAELEARDYPGAYHRVAFHRAGGEDVYIETTRPELIPAVVALIAHPDDERYQPLFGTTVTSPIFGVEVPVVAHPMAEMDKGAGIAMCCTFGDLTDVIWWRELHLPTRSIITRAGRITAETPEWLAGTAGEGFFASDVAGKSTFQARESIVARLRETGEMDGEPKPTQRKANFFEKGDKPLEIVTSRQWYIRNGGHDEALQQALVARGDEMDFVPGFMRSRYKNWIEGLNGDWLISRQRFFGVPFPVWYGVDAEGETDYTTILTPDEDRLPVDPTSDVPDGYTEDQRGKPGGFVGDSDIMDTWATSSLTPQIAAGWPVGTDTARLGGDPELFAKIFPFDQRPQGHDIIRTWLFATVVRAHHEHGTIPWTHPTINGWILDPDRKKMSKSKGNATTPIGLLQQHGTDGVRYWACASRPGVDCAFDESQMKVGRRLAMKVLNAAKFALSFGSVEGDLAAAVTEPLDQAMLATLRDVVEQSTRAYEAYDFARALELTESFFWTFCDDYIELVKVRAGGAEGFQAADYHGTPEQTASARAALRIALSVQLRLLAPVICFATEEVWSWFQEGSVHRAPWPTVAEVPAGGDAALLGEVGTVLAAVRRAKSEAKVGMKAQVTAITVAGPGPMTEHVKSAWSDLAAAGRVTAEPTWAEGELLTVDGVELLAPEK